MKPIGYYTNYTPGDGGLFSDMEESWGTTFEAITPYQRAWLMFQLAANILAQYSAEVNHNDNEVTEVAERLDELTLSDKLGLMDS